MMTTNFLFDGMIYAPSPRGKHILLNHSSPDFEDIIQYAFPPRLSLKKDRNNPLELSTYLIKAMQDLFRVVGRPENSAVLLIMSKCLC